MNPNHQDSSVLCITDIRTDGGTQNRSLNISLIHQYSALLAAEAVFPPVKVWFDGSHYWLADGFHRLAAAEHAGFKYIGACIQPGSLEDALWDSFSANSQHGLRRTRRDTVALIEKALKHSKSLSLSNVHIAKHLGIPEATVRRWRKRLSSPSDEDGSRIVSRKGTSYILRTAQIGTRLGHEQPRCKSKSQLAKELREMITASSPEVHPLLNAMDKWIFAGGPVAECLMALDNLMAYTRRPGERTGAPLKVAT